MGGGSPQTRKIAPKTEKNRPKGPIEPQNTVKWPYLGVNDELWVVSLPVCSTNRAYLPAKFQPTTHRIAKVMANIRYRPVIAADEPTARGTTVNHCKESESKLKIVKKKVQIQVKKK